MTNKFLNIDHIGIALNSLEEVLEIFPKISGLKDIKFEEVKEQKVKVAMVKCGNTNIEFITPTSEDSPISKFINKKGNGIHHIAFEVENLEEKLNELNDMKIKLIDKKPRDGANGKKIAFIHPHSTAGILIELCEHMRR